MWLMWGGGRGGARAKALGFSFENYASLTERYKACQDKATRTASSPYGLSPASYRGCSVNDTNCAKAGSVVRARCWGGLGTLRGVGFDML
jgi:hypothetical protein